MIVLDSSAVVEWLLGLPLTNDVASRIAAADSLHAPALLDVEVAQVVCRFAASGEITPQTGERALKALAELDAVRYTHELLLPVIWKLRDNLTAYDAAFAALAAALNAPLVTLDTRLARALSLEMSGQAVTVDLIAGH